jgi:hypothetical protein
MVALLDFSDTPASAFMRSVVKGMAAPFMVYGHFSTPIVIPPIQPVEATRLRPNARSDWEAIGGDLRVALSRYEREQ